MKKKITNITSAIIWLPSNEGSVKIQRINIKNMEDRIGVVSQNLGATISTHIGSTIGSQGRFIQIRKTSLNRKYDPNISSFYGKTSRYNPSLSIRYTKEHPIIKILLDSFYNGRISYYYLWKYLSEHHDFDWSNLAPYYNAITLHSFEKKSISEVQESISGHINENAFGQCPPLPRDSVMKENLIKAAKQGLLKPSYSEITEAAEKNELVLKRVFKKPF